MGGAREGQFSSGQPYLRLGQGPALLMATGLSPENANPAGLMRRAVVGPLAPLARHFTVYLTSRAPGLPAGCTMSDLAGQYASAIERDLDGPALVHGTSTGGSVALQLAIDHPQLVRRLVLASAACRLGPRGRHVQAELARLTRAGDVRAAWSSGAGEPFPRPLRPAARGLAWVFAPRLAPRDPNDLLATIDAEDVFDVEAQLDRVQAPTLVLGGGADPFYPVDLFRRTAAGIPQARLVVFPGKGHVYAASSKASVYAALGFLLAP